MGCPLCQYGTLHSQRIWTSQQPTLADHIAKNCSLLVTWHTSDHSSSVCGQDFLGLSCELGFLNRGSSEDSNDGPSIIQHHGHRLPSLIHHLRAPLQTLMSVTSLPESEHLLKLNALIVDPSESWVITQCWLDHSAGQIRQRER